jgi:hypothetical protein
MVYIVHSCKHVKCTIDERIWHSTERCHLQINAHLDINFRLVSVVNITVLLSVVCIIFNHTHGEIDTRSVEHQRIRQATEEPR